MQKNLILQISFEEFVTNKSNLNMEAEDKSCTIIATLEYHDDVIRLLGRLLPRSFFIFQIRVSPLNLVKILLQINYVHVDKMFNRYEEQLKEQKEIEKETRAIVYNFLKKYETFSFKYEVEFIRESAALIKVLNKEAEFISRNILLYF